MTRHTTTHEAQSGFILVAVLWLLLALATFAAVYAAYVASSITTSSAVEDEAGARPLARAALELTAFRLLAQSGSDRPARGGFSFPMNGARVSVSFLEETARIDLNAASLEQLTGLFTALGADDTLAEAAARHIVAWRSSDAQDSPASEAALYRDAGLGYGPRGAPFVHVGELWRVAGLPPDLVAAALPHVTVFSGQAKVNPAIADPVVLAAEESADKAAPEPDTPEQNGKADGADTAAPVKSDAAPPHSDAVRVTIRVDFDSGRHRTIEAVILVRDSGDVPYRVLAWSEGEPTATGTPDTAEGGR